MAMKTYRKPKTSNNNQKNFQTINIIDDNNDNVKIFTFHVKMLVDI